MVRAHRTDYLREGFRPRCLANNKVSTTIHFLHPLGRSCIILRTMIY
jgi:hypothetical protein